MEKQASRKKDIGWLSSKSSIADLVIAVVSLTDAHRH